MILYKYMSLGAAKSVIENSSIGFSCLEDLNDPFEGAALQFNAKDKLPSSVQHNAFKNSLSRKYALLSLTRNPLNALMWAHYGDDHRGVVIGIDINKTSLNDAETCIIPAKHGEIIYTKTMPKNILSTVEPEILMSVGEQYNSFHQKDYDMFKNTFLYKDTAWSYEEEVRVIKNITSKESISRYKNVSFVNKSGVWNQIQIYGRPLYCLKIPSEAIVEAYMGCNTYRNISRLGWQEQEYKNMKEKWKAQGIELYIVRRTENSWNLEVSDFKP